MRKTRRAELLAGLWLCLAGMDYHPAKSIGCTVWPWILDQAGAQGDP